MGFPPPGKPYRDLADAALLRRAALGPRVLGTEARPTIVKRLPLKPPVNTPRPIRIDPVPAEDLEPFPTIPRLGSTPEIPRIRVGSVVEEEDDDYVSIAMVIPERERLPSTTRRTILILAAILILLLAIWLFRRTATADSLAAPTPDPAPTPTPASTPLHPSTPSPLAPTPDPPVVKIVVPRAVASPSVRPERSRRAAPAKSRGIPALAFLTIDAIPYGTVYIDGAPAGQTPLIRVRLTAGSHQVRVVSSTGETRTVAIDLAAGADVRRRILFGDAP